MVRHLPGYIRVIEVAAVIAFGLRLVFEGDMLGLIYAQSFG